MCVSWVQIELQVKSNRLLDIYYYKVTIQNLCVCSNIPFTMHLAQ